MYNEKIREYRQARRLSQKELAKMIGTSQSCIFHYEKGTKDPRLSTLERIAKALGVTVIDLLK